MLIRHTLCTGSLDFDFRILDCEGQPRLPASTPLVASGYLSLTVQVHMYTAALSERNYWVNFIVLKTNLVISIWLGSCRRILSPKLSEAWLVDLTVHWGYSGFPHVTLGWIIFDRVALTDVQAWLRLLNTFPVNLSLPAVAYDESETGY